MPKSVQQMKDEMLEQYGRPEEEIKKGGMVEKLTKIGWFDLYAEEVLEYYASKADRVQQVPPREDR